MKIDNGRLTAYAYSLQQPRNFPPNTCVEGSTRTLRRDSVKAGARGPELPGGSHCGPGTGVWACRFTFALCRS